MAIQLIGNEIANPKPFRTQVWQATHDGADNRLPLMKRSFISFTYGGKNIEDFGLIAITENNSMERDLYAEFNDLTTDSDVLDGQFYWNSHYKSNTLDLALFTDEITERQLTYFTQWFKPGFARELILAEHPNRGIMARVAAQPRYHMLPFEKKIKSILYGVETSTTVYKGKIELSFIMDDPFWYSIKNLLDDDLNHPGEWQNISTKQYERIAGSKDALKIIEEDGIPSSLSLRGDVLIGNSIAVDTSQSQPPARTARGTNDTAIETYIGAYIGGYSVLSTSDSTFNLNVNEVKYFYYPGTAPCAPILEFTINFNTSGSLSSTINNTFTNSSHPYNSIYIESITAPRELRITTPSLITAYNQAVRLGSPAGEAQREIIRDKINHYKVRAAAINGGISSIFNSTTQADFKINCKTGEVLVTYHLKDGLLTEDAGDMIRSNYLKIEDRNFPNEQGYINVWTESNPEASHKLYHDISAGLTNVKLTYKYMYL